MTKVDIIPILSDNYCYVVQNGDQTAVIDPGEASTVIAFLEQNNITPDFIFITHHHFDHVDGVKALKEKYNCKVIVPKKEANKIAFYDQAVTEDSTLSLDTEKINIIETPGHTLDHICYHFTQSNLLFCGDTLFSMGCGRLFEGTADDMYKSFEKLKTLPDDTKIYCGHEYTLDNAKFCLSVDADNTALQGRANQVKELRATNTPTIPTTIELEKKTNIFIRCKDAQEFKHYRDLKDKF